ncbi:hypothetical protein F5Y15DRAFT_416467 [Xylariaceae sp. FL0016]|nr:hypothetical protein F5Y15DRAFT_416467 [Xylariaceae sp. FL0016]
MACVGDKLTGLAVHQMGFENNETTAEASRWLDTIANSMKLAGLCDEIGLADCINNNPSQQGTVSPKTKADTMEAVIGAAYVDAGMADGGIKAAFDFMRNLRVY